MPEVRDAYGKVIQRSKNLRGVRKYAATCRAEVIDLTRLPGGGGKLSILFADRSSFEHNFASFNVLLLFVTRWRSVYGAKLLIHGKEAGIVSKHTFNRYHQFLWEQQQDASSTASGAGLD